ncbi:radical SAM protein [Nanoarchaeota archaeon]
MTKTTNFQRAIFLSWYCSVGDCKFCYMSTQKDKIKDPKKARRRVESVIAEAIITKAYGWDIEFISGGYHSFSISELVNITKHICQIYGKKLWLNIGTFKKQELEKFLPYIEGVAGTIETINDEVRKDVCPSKPIEPIMEMFKACDELNLKKGITIIIGLGETEQDIPKLIDFIKKNNIGRITLYTLNPHEGTQFDKPPETDYFIKWISAVKKECPDTELIAGSWVDRPDEIRKSLEAGANYFTKFPAIKLFNSKHAKRIETEIKQAGREFIGTFTEFREIDVDKELTFLDVDDSSKLKIKEKVIEYQKTIKKDKD